MIEKIDFLTQEVTYFKVMKYKNIRLTYNEAEPWRLNELKLIVDKIGGRKTFPVKFNSMVYESAAEVFAATGIKAKKLFKSGKMKYVGTRSMDREIPAQEN